MESRYGIGVNNRYALFLDSDNEDGDNIDIMAKKASLTGDNQKGKALKDSQAKTKDAAPVKKDANNKVANNKDSSKPNNREGKFLNPSLGQTLTMINGAILGSLTENNVVFLNICASMISCYLKTYLFLSY